MRILSWSEIEKKLREVDLVAHQEKGFLAYSQGKVVMPPVGHLSIEKFLGECHIKYGYVEGDSIFVIKVATSFFKNVDRSIPNGNGLLIAFDVQTGIPIAILQDEGRLTDLRTAIAGRIAAKYLAPKNIKRIGIFGTGVQARLQLEHLKDWTDCREVIVWGRSLARLSDYQRFFQNSDFKIFTTLETKEVVSTCNLIVTATASREPLFKAKDVLPGTHITAVGADSGGKQELDPAIFARADLCVVDSLNQCAQFGDVSYALRENMISATSLVELGAVIAGRGWGRSTKSSWGRSHESQITVADLTGLAVQDIQMVKAVIQN